jgi:hypothetical protein
MIKCQRYKGDGGYLAAVIKIQSTFKMLQIRRTHTWFKSCKPFAKKILQVTQRRKFITYLRELRRVIRY